VRSRQYATAQPRYTSSVINARYVSLMGRAAWSRDSRCPLLIGRWRRRQATWAKWAWFGRSIVNKSTCPSISHRSESPEVVQLSYVIRWLRIITKTLTLVSLTHYCDDNNDDYDIAARLPIKVVHIGLLVYSLNCLSLLPITANKYKYIIT